MSHILASKTLGDEFTRTKAAQDAAEKKVVDECEQKEWELQMLMDFEKNRDQLIQHVGSLKEAIVKAKEDADTAQTVRCFFHRLCESERCLTELNLTVTVLAIGRTSWNSAASREKTSKQR